jgi:hypothetical protein
MQGSQPDRSTAGTIRQGMTYTELLFLTRQWKTNLMDKHRFHLPRLIQQGSTFQHYKALPLHLLNSTFLAGTFDKP